MELRKIKEKTVNPKVLETRSSDTIHLHTMTVDTPRCRLTSSLNSGSLVASFLFPLLSPFETDPLLLDEFDALLDRRLFEFDLPLPPRLPPLTRPRPPELLPPLDGFLPPDAAPDGSILLL
jgi:hypothetical protein